MANIITTLTTRLVNDRGTNKAFPCKTYSTAAAAETAAQQMAKQAAAYYNMQDDNFNYLVISVAEFGRYVAAFDFSATMRNPKFPGGYVGFIGSKGFYCF